VSGEWVAAGKRGDRDVVLSDLYFGTLARWIGALAIKRRLLLLGILPLLLSRDDYLDRLDLIETNAPNFSRYLANLFQTLTKLLYVWLCSSLNVIRKPWE
jgi:hypothetical protein